MIVTNLTDKQWQQYEADGYLFLGRQFDPEKLAEMQSEMDRIMLGEADVPYDKMLMQLDSSTGDYGDLASQSNGFKGATLNYRKIEDLELDPVFLRYLQKSLYVDICNRAYGRDIPIDCFRAMFMNKPAGAGTLLPWHQDRWSELNTDPLITIWLALDPATIDNGCVQIIPGSHKWGIINPDHQSAFLTEAQAEERTRDQKILNVELDAGEAVLLHNWTLHRSDTNHTNKPRRAFSVCYMDSRTKRTDDSDYVFRRVLGNGALTAE